MIDSHAHLNDEAFNNNLDLLIEECKKNNINKIICPGWDIESSKKAIDISHKYEIVYSAVGIHPENVKGLSIDVLKEIEDMSNDYKCVAIGEIGLDYYWTKDTKDLQIEFLTKQLELARKIKKPVIIHLREATEDILNIFESFVGKNGKVENIGIMHCFSGSKDTMKKCIDYGFYISFGGPVTFKNAVSVKENAMLVPLDKLLIETDSPYLAPHPFRGKPNSPLYVHLVLEEIARLKDKSVKELEEKIEENLEQLFHFKEIKS